MYYLFRLATLVLPWIPGWLMYRIGYGVGLLAWLIAGRVRRQATRNMMHVLGEEGQGTREGRRRLRRTVQGMFVNNARNYLELFSLGSLSSEEVLRTIRVEGVEHLDAGFKQGKGVIIFAVHQGPFDYIVQYMGIQGYDVTIPVERVKDERMLDLMLDLRNSHGVQYLPLGGSSPMRTMVQKLRDNKIVLIVADRAIEGQSIEADFFGAPARLPSGPVRLAHRTGAALIGAHCWRTPEGLASGEWVPLSLGLPDEQQSDIEYLMRAMIEKMEQFIREHPEQWVAFAPIWIEDVTNDA